MTTLFVSGYTIGTGYEEEVKTRLEPSLQKFGLDYELVGYTSRGSWRENIWEKPFILDACRRRWKDCSLVWLDADAEVVAYPKMLFSINLGFAAHFRQPKGNLSSGTMVFGKDISASHLLGFWRSHAQSRALGYLQESEASQTEQACLEKLVSNCLPDHRLTMLPLRYSTIFDGPQPNEDPVIVHYQASRRLKAKVDSAG